MQYLFFFALAGLIIVAHKEDASSQSAPEQGCSTDAPADMGFPFFYP